MSTPVLNSVPTTSFTLAPGNDGALQYGVKWGGGPYGTGVALTYSFPSGVAHFISGYDEFDSFYPLTATEKNGVRAALAEWASVAKLTFTEVSDGNLEVGDLRFAVTDSAGAHEAAHAFLPGDTPEAGDVWFKNGVWHKSVDSEVRKGSYDYLTILHEIGHALGFDHPFDGTLPYLPGAYDSYAFTVMSYSAAVGGNDNYANFYPTTPMYYDLVNMQGIYGRGTHNPGNTTYTYREDKHYWQTIDDTGGTDTIVYKGRGHSKIDLNVGEWSDLGRTIEFNDGSTRSTVMIGPGTTIENATGGRGKDTIIGNDAANLLSGGVGKDALSGDGGHDRFLFDAKLKPGNVDRITDFDDSQDLILLATGKFGGLPTGTLTAAAFDQHIDYASTGALAFDGKVFAKLAPGLDIDHTDFLVV